MPASIARLKAKHEAELAQQRYETAREAARAAATAGTAAAASTAVEDDHVDPLDAFMQAEVCGVACDCACEGAPAGG